MQLLTDKIFETDNTIKLMNILSKTLSNRVDGKFYISKYISYDDFKIMLHTFIVEIMYFFLEDTKYSNDSYDVFFKKLPRKVKGEFVNNGNILIINDDIIKSIYDGKLDDIDTIFHELNHFKVKYELRSGVINRDICRIAKESLIRYDEMEPNHKLGKILKGKDIYIDDFYYKDNYLNYSEEVIVRIRASKDMILFSKMLVIFSNLSNRNKVFEFLNNKLNDMIKEDKIRYNYYNRDLRMNLMFNSNFLDFDEAFDFLVKYSPEWLKTPQISVEYYLDSDGYVKKKDVLQLKNDLAKIDDIDTREYVEYLIKNIEDKEITQGKIKS